MASGAVLVGLVRRSRFGPVVTLATGALATSARTVGALVVVALAVVAEEGRAARRGVHCW